MRQLIKSFFLNKLRRHYQWIGNDRSELKRITLTIRFLLISIIGAVVFVIQDAYFGLGINVAFDIILLASFVLAYYLINHQYVSIGKLIIFTVGNVVLFISASSQGRAAGNFFIFFPMLTGIFTIFSYREFRYLLLSVLLTLLDFVLLELTNYAYLVNPDLPQQYGQTSYIINFVICTSMVGYFVYYHAKANSKTEDKLKTLNQRLQAQNQKLLKTNNELDSFVYKASHDLRAPLTSLLGLIDIARLENDPEKLKYYFALQEKLIRRLDTYIMDILAISRNTKLDLMLEPIDFESMIAQSLEQLKYLEAYPMINKEIHINNKEVAFHSDSKRLSIIFNNLLANAIRYADTSKEMPSLSLEITLHIKEATIILKDNGIGIEANHLNKIFQMFYRATDKNSGSGLGLYIVKEITEKLYGKITVTSEAGKWSQFEIHIPNALHANYPGIAPLPANAA